MKIKILIIEDERPASERMIKLLRDTGFEIEILGVTEGVEKTINWLSSNPDPDLIFMDIQLDDGICFEIFDSVKVNVPVIFTTAYDAYAIQAFKVNSIDYLLKPIEPELLRKAIEKYRQLYTRMTLTDKDLGSLITSLVSQPYKERFFIKTGSHYRSIPANEVSCFLVSEKNTFLQTFSGQLYDMDYSLDNLEKILNPACFFRVNRNFIIQLNAISDIVSYSASRMKIKLKNNRNNDEIIISRERMQEFRKWMDR